MFSEKWSLCRFTTSRKRKILSCQTTVVTKHECFLKDFQWLGRCWKLFRDLLEICFQVSVSWFTSRLCLIFFFNSHVTNSVLIYLILLKNEHPKLLDISTTKKEMQDLDNDSVSRDCESIILSSFICFFCPRRI